MQKTKTGIWNIGKANDEIHRLSKELATATHQPYIKSATVWNIGKARAEIGRLEREIDAAKSGAPSTRPTVKTYPPGGTGPVTIWPRPAASNGVLSLAQLEKLHGAVFGNASLLSFCNTTDPAERREAILKAFWQARLILPAGVDDATAKARGYHRSSGCLGADAMTRSMRQKQITDYLAKL